MPDEVGFGSTAAFLAGRTSRPLLKVNPSKPREKWTSTTLTAGIRPVADVARDGLVRLSVARSLPNADGKTNVLGSELAQPVVRIAREGTDDSRRFRSASIPSRPYAHGLALSAHCRGQADATVTPACFVRSVTDLAMSGMGSGPAFQRLP
jgi:hypothetical protein